MKMYPFQQLAARISGELLTDGMMRKLYATDASEYQEIPAAVAFPKTEADVREIILFAGEQKIGIIPRTAGTSLAGQVVGSGIVVDLSRHFNKIVKIDRESHRVTVQPGIVRNELNFELAKHGLFFGPETSTSNRAMIGGMVGNNSCGSNSIVYGSTRDHLLSVRGFFSDGSEGVLSTLTPDEFQKKCQKEGSLEGRIYRSIRDILGNSKNRSLITENFPLKSIPRRNTGYALDLLMDAKPLDPSSLLEFSFCKLIAGSEGTLFLGLEFELDCDPLPSPHVALLCGHFSSIDEALRANLLALNYAPSACELIDRHILECTKENLTQQRNRSFVVGDPGAILVVEIRRDLEREVSIDIAALQSAWETGGYGYAAPVLRGEECNKVWELRRAGQGLMSNIFGDAKPREVVEDTAVAVPDLPAYIAEFDAILQTKYGIDCVYYAHAGSGELHTRPLFGLKTEQGIKTFRSVAADIAKLVKKYRGSLSGEHGDGRLRGEFIPLMVGPECYDMMKAVKRAFDPENLFNPGKIVETPPMDTHLRHHPGHQTPEYTTVFDFSDVGGIVRAAEKCSGSGDCRKSQLAGGTMCPSYMATREEKHTTRARANILRLILNYPEDAANPFDSTEIKEVMDLCLSCKGCKSECPSSVDITKLKAEFLQHYHDVHGVPFRSQLIAGFEEGAHLASFLPAISNALLQTPWIRRAFNKMVGFHPDRTLPRFNRTTLRHWFKTHRPLTPLSSPKTRHGRVHFFCDEFTNHNDLDAGIATIELLERLGYEVLLPLHGESGRASLSKGLLRKAKAFAAENVRRLAPIISENEPLIGIEPSAFLGFRDEYPVIVDPSQQDAARSLARNCLLLEEFIVREAAAGKITADQFTEKPQTIHLHGHCHQKALASMDSTVQMLSLPENYRVHVIPSGCCGMAGSFGYEVEHYDLSMKIGELVLFPSVRKLSRELLVAASGTSCRHQIHDGTARRALHPAEILRAAIQES